METLTESLAIDYLRRAVAEYGAEYVDPMATENDACQNVYTDGEGNVTGRCIAAQVLSYHGVSDDDLYSCNDHGIEQTIRDLGPALDLPVEEAADDLLLRAQIEQDGGSTWGEAVESAIHGNW